MNRKLITILAATTCIVIVAFCLPPIRQNQSYHQFADQRTLLGIRNCLNVISNAAFILIAVVGFTRFSNLQFEHQRLFIFTLSLGILFTAIGSTIYHLNPNNTTLVVDRLPMTIIFMTCLSSTISTFINKPIGLYLLPVLIFVGVFSVWWWYNGEANGTGDLRLYGIIQFYPMIMLPLILVLYWSKKSRIVGVKLIYAVTWYAIAKITETFDHQIFSYTGWISGHTLKHLGASISTYYLIAMLTSQHPMISKTPLSNPTL